MALAFSVRALSSLSLYARRVGSDSKEREVKTKKQKKSSPNAALIN
jgi:hypothetical protein